MNSASSRLEVVGSPARDREAEHRWGELAVAEARKSPGTTRVGVVLVATDGSWITGHRGELGGPHAEQVVLQKAEEAGIDVRGATLFTTLEPCANSRTARVPCAELLTSAGIAAVHIGEYDPNPQVHRLGWRHLRDHGVLLRDFPKDLRDECHEVARDFTSVFTRGVGMSAGAKFDFSQNGGRFSISVDDDPEAPTWTTRWSSCGARAIYLNGGRPGHVALARYASSFDEIDDPDALDYGSHVAKIAVGDIGVMRNAHGHVLCRVKSLEPTADYGGGPHVSVTIEWEIRLSEQE